VKTIVGSCALVIVNTPKFDELREFMTSLDIGQFSDPLKPLPELKGRRMLVDLRLMREYVVPSEDISGEVDEVEEEQPSELTPTLGQEFREVINEISRLLGKTDGDTNVFDWNLLQVEEDAGMP